jgi:ketosteroid isomerase-like protein
MAPGEAEERATGYGNPAARVDEAETVRAIYDAFARRDVEAALEFIADDAEFHPIGTAARTGRTEPYRGHDGVREYFADAARVWDDLRITADDVRVAGGGVIAFGHVEGTVGGESVRTAAIWIWQVRDRLARSMRVSDLG